jgi:heme o synthase
MIKTADGTELAAKEAVEPPGLCEAFFILAKPGIVAAVTFSGITGMIVGGRGLPPLDTGIACAASLLLMAAGSALTNSVLDRKMDQQMARLTLRSAALKRVGTAKAALAAVALTTAAVALAAASLSTAAAILLVAAALSYTLYYTLFLKRHTPWAAVLGGLPGALPILIGQAAVAPHADPGSLALFLIMLIWQPPHFWLLSLSHRDEYGAAGVPVLPLVKGDSFTRTCIYLGVAALTPATLLLHYFGPCSASFAAFAFIAGGIYLAACHCYLVEERFRAAFRSSILYILSLFVVIVADLCL